MQRLTQRFPQLLLDTLRETCPACGTTLSDAQVRRGWREPAAARASDWTTCCPAPACAAAAGGSTARFVARFSVTCGARDWRGSGGAMGPGAPLLCEFMPPRTLLAALAAALAAGHVGPHLRLRAPALFWNLLLSAVSMNLPAECFAFLAREAEEGRD